MKSNRNSKFARALVVVTVLGVLTANGTAANAVVNKTITCYKGTAVKKVTAVTPKCPVGWTLKKTITCYKGTAVKKVVAIAPKCPVGWSIKKPVVKPTVQPTVKPTSATVAFSGTYKGKIAVLWSDSGVKASSVTGTGTGTILGLDALTGSGSAAPQNQCDGINGSGVLSGGGNTLKVSFDSSAKGCAADEAAPTVISITGNAVIQGGTGKYAGAAGTLKVTGSFAIKSKDAGFSESSALTLTLSGNINTK